MMMMMMMMVVMPAYRAIGWIVVTMIPDYIRVQLGLTCDCCD
jgi:hypothetical protein